MRKGLLVLGLIMSALCLGGCLVIVSEEVEEPAACEPADETIAEIDAVSKLAFDSDRQQGYKRIAERVGLSDAAQVCLVKKVFDKLAFEDAKEDVLLALIDNPSFSYAGEQAILERLDRLAFENSKVRVLKAINGRKS